MIELQRSYGNSTTCKSSQYYPIKFSDFSSTFAVVYGPINTVLICSFTICVVSTFSTFASREERKKPGKPPKWSGLRDGTKTNLTLPNLSF